MLNLLDPINHGWRDVEPVIVGLMAMHRSFMLIGRHGTGKTRLAKALSSGYGEHGFVFYDATKDDLISIAGIPDPNALKEGRLHFVPHQRAIWDKSTIVVDEITRAGKESQNLWLEIIEERTCFGLPLAYRTFIATANPESYAAAFQLDEALLDRFHAVIPVPEHQQPTTDAVRAMIALASEGSAIPEAEVFARVFAEIQAAHAELLAAGAMDRISAYLGNVIPALLGTVREQSDTYISARTFSRNLPQTLLAIAAYHQVAGQPQPLRAAATDALRFAIATKFGLATVLLQQLHASAEALLDVGDIDRTERLRLEIAATQSFEDRLAYLQTHWGEVAQALAIDEVEKLLGELLRGASQKGEQEKLVELRHLLAELNYSGDAVRQVDGRLLIALNAAVNHAMPKLGAIFEGRPHDARYETARANVDWFRAMVAQGTFLANRSEGVRRLQTYLIDLKEGDVADTPDDLFAFFADGDLTGHDGG